MLKLETKTPELAEELIKFQLALKKAMEYTHSIISWILIKSKIAVNIYNFTFI